MGLSALPAVFAKGGPTKPKRDKPKSKKEKGDPKAKLDWDDEDIVFMTSEGQPRDSGIGEASTAAKEIISGAVKREATDIHLEPKGEEIQIRYRIDGELSTANSYDYELGPPIITSLKVNSELDIAENRRTVRSTPWSMAAWSISVFPPHPVLTGKRWSFASSTRPEE